VNEAETIRNFLCEGTTRWREARVGRTVFTARQVFTRTPIPLTDLGPEYHGVNRRWLVAIRRASDCPTSINRRTPWARKSRRPAMCVTVAHDDEATDALQAQWTRAKPLLTLLTTREDPVPRTPGSRPPAESRSEMATTQPSESVDFSAYQY
jgi:hypothetical protein